MTVVQAIGILCAAMVAGAINAVAGGGTLITFPALVWSGLEDQIANATSTVGLWPGSIGGVWGYRRELAGVKRWLILLVPSVAGGITGAWLLLATPASVFRFLVPYLIFAATCLFMIQGWLARVFARRDVPATPTNAIFAMVLIAQFAIATYGGYFGAGIGILMLALHSCLGIESVHELNGLKTTLAACINGIAAAWFVYAGAADWQRALAMITGSIAGGYGGASLARRLGQKTVRVIVVIIGFLITAVMLYRQFANR